MMVGFSELKKPQGTNQSIENADTLDFSENEKLSREKKKNIAAAGAIEKRIEETRELLIDIIEKHRIRTTEKDRMEYKKSKLSQYQEFPSVFYSREDLEVIKNILIRLQEAVSDAADASDFPVRTDSNLCHILNNGPYNFLGFAERESFDRNVPRDETKVSFRNEMRTKSKRLWDAFLFYMEYISNPKNIPALKSEITSEDGYLEHFAKYYKSGKVTSQSESRITHFDFFARIGNHAPLGDSELLKIKGEKRLRPILTAGDFSKEFENLPGKETLDREKILRELLIPAINKDEIEKAA